MSRTSASDGSGSALQEGPGTEHHGRRGIARLHRTCRHEGGLDRVELGFVEVLDRDDLVAVGLRSQHAVGVHEATIDQAPPMRRSRRCPIRSER